MRRNNFIPVIVGFLVGALLAAGAEALIYKKKGNLAIVENTINMVTKKLKKMYYRPQKIVENFSQSVTSKTGQSFGDKGWLTQELYRKGTFVIDGKSGFALQKSDNYRDSAFIRTTRPLPDTYKIWAIVGEINYGLDNIFGLEKDSEYTEGPKNENGAYLLVITDTLPQGHHTNTWWHQHRKVVIDVDNNTWGHGMPTPIFMVYLTRENNLRSFNGASNSWVQEWEKAVPYSPQAWYKVEVEKTSTEFIMSIYSETGEVLKRGRIALSEVWNVDGHHPEYLVIGDPHENYYQGTFKIREIGMSF